MPRVVWNKQRSVNKQNFSKKMKILISPAKSLNETSELPTSRASEPIFLAKSEILNKAIKKKSPETLSKLMHISNKLAELNWQRNHDWKIPFSADNARPAIYTFDGDVYTGIDAYSFPTEKLDLLQNKLRILSGLYGLLKPLDLIQPYRLEMGTKLSVNNAKNLYEYWRETLTNHLSEELLEGELVVNLASNEYAKAIDFKKLNQPIITPVFKDWKNDKLKVISFYAKKARGLMSRYLIENNIESLAGIKAFNVEEYRFSDEHTLKENEPIFVR